MALALETGLAVISSRRWGDASADGEVELDTGVFTGVWSRSVLERHGGWDSGWPINQDSELAARVLAAGERIVQLPSMGAAYVPRDSLKSLARQYYRYGLYRGKTARAHANSLRRSHLLGPGLVLACLGALVAPTRALRRLSRAAVGAYLLALVAASARAAAASPDRAGDAATLPAVFVTMHGAWGVGFVVSTFKHGPPIGALARVAGLRRGT